MAVDARVRGDDRNFFFFSKRFYVFIASPIKDAPAVVKVCRKMERVKDGERFSFSMQCDLCGVAFQGKIAVVAFGLCVLRLVKAGINR